jgi:capsular polysaccharide biosynthesis protein
MGLEEFLDALRRHKKIPIIVALLTAIAIAWVVRNHDDPDPEYTSSVQIQVRDVASQSSSDLLLSLVQNPDDTTSLVLADRVFFAAGVDPTSAEITTVVNVPEGSPTGFVDITVKGDNPVFVFDTASKLREGYVAERTKDRGSALQAEFDRLARRVEGIEAQRLELLDQVNASRATPIAKVEDVLQRNADNVYVYADVDETLRTAIQSQTDLLAAELQNLANADLALEGAASPPDETLGPTPAVESTDKDELEILIPIGALVALALLVGIGGALFLSKLDHTLGEPADAAHALRAPVLGTVARRRRAERSPVALDPKAGARMRQFRSLAATVDSMGTMPKRIFVTAPTASPEIARVGTNLAVCLAELGHTVVLVATEPDHLGALGNLTPSHVEGYAELIEQAKSGAVNGEVQMALRPAPGLPSLWVLPPGMYRAHAQPRAVAYLFSGIEGGLDDRPHPEVTIVLGSSMLDDPDAAVLARESGHVLWVVETGTTAEEAAAVAQQRLALTGIDPIGVAVVVGPGL